MSNRYFKPGDHCVIRYGYGVSSLVHQVIRLETNTNDASTACYRNVAHKKRSKDSNGSPYPVQSDSLSRKPVNCMWCRAGIEGPDHPEQW
jgi:hypothetical protein